MKLAWDGVAQRFYETGTSHGVLFVQDDDGTYGKGVAWNGLTAVTESPGGAEPTDLYADDIKYATLRSAETFGATIEAYTYPEEFAVCDGSVDVAPGVYLGQQSRRGFGFSYRTIVGNDVNSELGYKLHLVYGATASPSEKSYSTVNDSPDAITFSWEISTTPVDVSGYKAVASITIDSTKLTASGKAALAKLEEKLYGTEDDESSLPLPSEIIEMFKDETEEP